MHRRQLLRVVASVGATGLLTACTRGPSPETANPAATPSDTFDPVGRVAPDAEEVLSVISGSFEQLAGPERNFAFGLVGPDNEPVRGADVEVWVVPVEGGTAGGPYASQFHEVPGQPLGLYVARVDLTAPGATSFVAVTADQRAGAETLTVATPQTSQLPAPTQPAKAVPTPTVQDLRGVQRLCTQEPACSMHEVSLDEALAAGRPVMLTFATPAFCETAVCGPSVSVLDQVRASRDWGETAFIHVEVYADAGQTVAEPVTAWGLPSEPWLFAIARDGVIAARADGPLLTLTDQVTAMVEQVQSPS